jgi:hypothetical protein
MSQPIELARRSRYALGVLVASVLVLAFILDHHQPVQDWLFFRYLRATALAGLFALTCLVAGHAITVRTLRRTLPLEEHVAIAFALGILAFFLSSLAFGLLGLYGLPFFFLGPFSLLALGARDCARTWNRARRHFARLDFRLPLGPLQGVILAFGCVSILELWFTILTPQNASYDARWRHLPIAEHYVAQGGISAFLEGWVPGAQPQLGSLLYAWPFSMPGTLFDRVEAAAHVELAIFLMTLVGVVAIARRILRKRVPLSWVALFLFPGIFCYDSGLVLGVDHVAAVFAAPIFLMAMRYWQKPEVDCALLLGAVASGAMNTKYTAIILLPLPFVVVAARALLPGERPAKSWLPAAASVGALLALTAPHWLRNLVYYGDPLFPALRRWLPSRPWSPAANAPYESGFLLFRPPLTVSGLVEMAKTLFTFSFVVHDFPQYHGDLPVFGSLFTLFTPLLLFLRRRPLLLWLFGGVYLGIASWFWIHELDRYLQVLVPWMAAAVAVVVFLVWREGGALRWAVGVLVTLQVVWGANIYFMPTHRAAGAAIPKLVVDLLGHHGDSKPTGDRFTSYPDWEPMGAALPVKAKVLVHEEEIHLGIAAPSMSDYPGNQGVFYWGEPGSASPERIWTLLRSYGITHVVWAKQLDHAADTVAGGLAFFDFVTHHTKTLGTYHGFVLAALLDTAPSQILPGEVAYYPCDATSPFAPGLYPLESMARSPGDTRPIAPAIPGVSMEEAFERARFLVYDVRCHGPLPDKTRDRFELLAARGQAMMLERKSAP